MKKKYEVYWQNMLLLQNGWNWISSKIWQWPLIMGAHFLERMLLCLWWFFKLFNILFCKFCKCNFLYCKFCKCQEGKTIRAILAKNVGRHWKALFFKLVGDGIWFNRLISTDIKIHSFLGGVIRNKVLANPPIHVLME